jgi:hypothetical protein
VKWITLGGRDSGDGAATGWREPISISGQGKAAWASYSAGGLVFLGGPNPADVPRPAADPHLAGQPRRAGSFGIHRVFVNGAHIGMRNDKPPGYLVRQMAARNAIQHPGEGVDQIDRALRVVRTDIRHA